MANPGIDPRRVSPDYYMDLADPISDVLRNCEDDLLVNIARHFRATSNEEKDIFAWQVRKLAELGKLNAESLRIITGYVGQLPSMTRLALERAAFRALKEIDPELHTAWRAGALTGPGPARTMSQTMASVVARYERQAIDKLNLVNTVMLNSTRERFVKTVTDVVRLDQQLARAQQVLNQQTGQVVAGITSRREAVRQAVTQMADEGLTGFVDRAGRQWSPEAYVNMDIRTTAHNVAEAAVDERNEDYGNDLFLIDSHSGARPKCARDQGKIYSSQNRSGTVEDLHGKQHKVHPWSASSYGEPDGILGINCGHHKYVFIPGFTVPRFGETQNAEKNAEQYAESQRQRYLERQVRDAKRRAAALEAAGDEEGAKQARQLVRQRQAKVRQFTEDTGRTRRPDREQIHGYDYGKPKK